MSYWESLTDGVPKGEGDQKGKRALACNVTKATCKDRSKQAWNPPDEGWIKVNVDAAYVEASGEAGIGVAIRDHRGSVLLSEWKKVFDAGSAEEIEAQACREGLVLAAEWTPDSTILESDCSTVARYLANPKIQRTAACYVIREAVEISRSLPRIVFRHIGRASNTLAHKLAQLARRLNHSAVWRNRCPASVEHLVAQDVNTRIIQ
ncbi:hypothetical protein C2845_PM13G07950 [Panicum miliaceum]|uniref:RNase H type-1 domain-containing protein n=1 Tax=Panicum miliaceum TaxID=4540 RepID=A0A3L6RK97_PANMI|nr:hypothetical protein C2845_PM13G07950 [Panicum miliaceum]